MSDPVTNVEIEDVLSSIRRLVSSEGRTGMMPPRETPKEPQKLVLTPALRVDDARPAPPAAPAEAPQEMAENQPAQDKVSDQSEEDSAPGGDLPDRSAELTARVAELEHIVASRSDQWEPDGQSSDDYSGGPVDPLPWEDYVPETLADPVEEIEDEAAAEDDHAAADPDEDSGGWLEDEADLDQDDWAASDLEPEPEPEPERATAPDETRFDSALEGEDMLGDAEDVLDEDALRDLVAEIVRQELQGALGERITRNVRKLVRREIHRALTAQELD